MQVKFPINEDEIEKAVESSKKTVMDQVTKTASQIAKDTSQQVAPLSEDAITQSAGSGDAAAQSSDQDNKEFVKDLYGPTKKPTSTLAAGQQQSSQSNQQVIDPEKQMTEQQKKEYTEEQKEAREKRRLHERNYATVASGIDTIGTLEEQVAKVRKQREQEEEQRKKEEAEKEEEEKKKKEEEMKQQVPMPAGKRAGVPPDVLKREQNKAESNRGTSG